ncbi:MAG: hypothetical protein ACD_3C00202G0002 [uncultured bacterium (gcode 4)]|uniref:Inner membrane protein YgaP-like transmembrane domain-containing protein n=1 Tax=uncultured bacterium (gcode 4) TaxID=1234023 RepID=K2F8J0_9BACT|nr:MAG: hypothetical protein ACD_3C00202G0002 [uncultured bacterium (gcode 4)]
MFIQNVGCLDRCLRVAAWTALITSYNFMQDSPWILLLWIMPLVTGFIGWCWTYSVFWINSIHKKKDLF